MGVWAAIGEGVPGGVRLELYLDLRCRGRRCEFITKDVRLCRVSVAIGICREGKGANLS